MEETGMPMICLQIILDYWATNYGIIWESSDTHTDYIYKLLCSSCATYCSYKTENEEVDEINGINNETKT